MPKLRINFKPHTTARASAHYWFGGCSGGTADREPSSIKKSPNLYTPPSSAASKNTNAPLGILGYRGVVLPPHWGVKDAVVQAPSPPSAAVQVCKGALCREVDASWPSLPPAVTAVRAATMLPTTASRRQRRAEAAVRRNTAMVAATLAASAAALAASFSGSHRAASGSPGAGGDASFSTLAPQAVPGAGSWADLMDADDAAAQKAAGLGELSGAATRLHIAQRCGNCGAHAHGGPEADLSPYPEVVYTAVA